MEPEEINSQISAELEEKIIADLVQGIPAQTIVDKYGVSYVAVYDLELQLKAKRERASVRPNLKADVSSALLQGTPKNVIVQTFGVNEAYIRKLEYELGLRELKKRFMGHKSLAHDLKSGMSVKDAATKYSLSEELVKAHGRKAGLFQVTPKKKKSVAEAENTDTVKKEVQVKIPRTLANVPPELLLTSTIGLLTNKYVVNAPDIIRYRERAVVYNTSKERLKTALETRAFLSLTDSMKWDITKCAVRGIKNSRGVLYNVGITFWGSVDITIFNNWCKRIDDYLDSLQFIRDYNNLNPLMQTVLRLDLLSGMLLEDICAKNLITLEVLHFFIQDIIASDKSFERTLNVSLISTVKRDISRGSTLSQVANKHFLSEEQVIQCTNIEGILDDSANDINLRCITSDFHVGISYLGVKLGYDVSDFVLLRCAFSVLNDK